jgi:hypothetical protein
MAAARAPTRLGVEIDARAKQDPGLVEAFGFPA